MIPKRVRQILRQASERASNALTQTSRVRVEVHARVEVSKAQEDEAVEDSDPKTLPEGWTIFESTPPSGVYTPQFRLLMATVPRASRPEVLEMLGLPEDPEDVRANYTSIPDDATAEEAAEAWYGVGMHFCPECYGLDPECEVQPILDELWKNGQCPVHDDHIFTCTPTWLAVVQTFETG